MLGENPVTVERGTTYSDAGATADTGETVTPSGTVNTNVIGTYTITYSATDAAGNTGTATRTVNVVDRIDPVITNNLLSNINNGQTILGTVRANETVTWSTLNSDIQVDENGNVSLKQLANYETKESYTYTITAIDNAGNTNSVTHTTNIYEVFTAETKTQLQAAINKWYEIAAVSLDSANSYIGVEYSGNPSTWDVKLVKDMSNLFKGKVGNNHPEIGTWNTCFVTTMESMFEESSFNNDIGGWNVHNVNNFQAMFKNNTNFDNAGSDSIDEWTTYWTHKKRC